VCLVNDAGELVEHTAAPPDADGLRHLAERVRGVRVRAVIESMTGARFVHDTLEELGWEVLVADAQKVKGLAPLACKTDKIDARVLAELSWRDLVPTIWLPDPAIRRERELARYRLHLVRHPTTLKNRIRYVLFFIELDTRRVRLAGITQNPSGGWVTQQARNVVIDASERKRPTSFLIHHREAKFSAAFDEVFRTEGITVIRTPFRAPNANANAERFAPTLREECLDSLLIVGRHQLERVLREYVDHYSPRRCSAVQVVDFG
jgi:hypothetical protein